MNASRCSNCKRLFHTAELKKIKNVEDRVAAGEPMPSGDCPKCGALCHLFTEYTDSEQIIMRFFAEGFLTGMPEVNRASIDEWHSPYEGIDLHFIASDDEENVVEVWSYHRDKFTEGDCVDEVRVI